MPPRKKSSLSAQAKAQLASLEIEAEELQKLHVHIATQIRNLQFEESILKKLLDRIGRQGNGGSGGAGDAAAAGSGGDAS